MVKDYDEVDRKLREAGNLFGVDVDNIVHIHKNKPTDKYIEDMPGEIEYPGELIDVDVNNNKTKGE